MENNHAAEEVFSIVVDSTKNELEVKSIRAREHTSNDSGLKRAIKDDIAGMLKNLAASLGEEKNPEAILKRCLEGMDGIDRKSFVLDNLLEGLKRGEKPGVLLKRYKELGLADFSGVANFNDLTTEPGFADVLAEIKKKFLRRPKTTLIKLLKVSAKVIPRLVKVKFTSRLTTGFIPMPELYWSDDAGLSDLTDPLLEALQD